MSDTKQHRHHHGHPDPDAYHWHLHDDHDKDSSTIRIGTLEAHRGNVTHALSLAEGVVTIVDMERWNPTAFVHGEIEWRELEAEWKDGHIHSHAHNGHPEHTHRHRHTQMPNSEAYHFSWERDDPDHIHWDVDTDGTEKGG